MSNRTITLPRLTKWQADVFDEIGDARGSGKRVIVKARRQCGKSILAEILLIKYCLEKKCVSIILSPTLNQSRKIFKDICNLLDGSGAIASANATLLTMEFSNKSQLLLKSAEQRESLRGFTVSGILVIDEGAYIPKDVYEVVYPYLDANNAPLVVLSTPLFKDGEFYDLFNNENNITFDWAKYDTSEFLSPERLEYYRSTLTENKFKSEYLGEFIEDGSFVFGNIRGCVKDYSKKAPIYMGVDWGVGGEGNDDYTAITMMDDDGNITHLEYFNHTPPTEQVERIAKLINSTPSLKKVEVEQNSIGSVYFDFLKAKVKKKEILSTFLTTNDSKRKIIENLVKAFNEGTVGIVDDAELIKELQHYAIEKTKTGYTYNGYGAHDDLVISLAICYNLKNKNNTYNIVFHR